MQKRLIFLLIVLFSCVSLAGRRDSLVDGKKLMIAVPLKNLGLSNNSLDLEFKWSDNMQVDDDPLDWYVNGDAAPGARFNYIYSVIL